MKDRLLENTSPRAAAFSLRQGVCILLVALLMAACGSRTGSEAAGTVADTAASTDAKPARLLSIPPPPATLASQQEQVAYVAEHYWDNFDFADTGWVADTAALEQTFVNYLSLLPMLPAERAAKVQRTLIDSTSRCTPMFDRFAEMQEHYLYDPNSPMRNEELYIPVLEAVITLPALDEVYKIRPRFQLEMAQKNRPGMVAADFACTTSEGRTVRLSGIRSEYTVLFFYNPDCEDCKRVKAHIASSPVFSSLRAAGSLAVLAVYTDEDVALWRAHLAEMPAGWTVGYDKGQAISKKRLYDLRAIPALYLLDKQKRVVLKDAPVERIEAWLEQTRVREIEL